ncbi:MAG: hypothetical protein AAFQ99_14105, partial [Pseudomonadota bacterium]
MLQSNGPVFREQRGSQLQRIGLIAGAFCEVSAALRSTFEGRGTTMTRKYFGTDGIRGQANKHPMTAEVALRVGMAAGSLRDAGGATP